MLRRPILLLVMGLILMLSVPVSAGSKGERHHDRKEIKKDTKARSHTRQTIDQLQHAIDLWHDATLKSDDKLARQYTSQITVLMENDLQYTRKIQSDAEREQKQSRQELNRGHSQVPDKLDDLADFHDDRNDAKQIREIYMVKKRLYNSFKRGKAFSNRYRLLGDYLGVLKRQDKELGVELAEDIGELREDRHQR